MGAGRSGLKWRAGFVGKALAERSYEKLLGRLQREPSRIWQEGFMWSGAMTKWRVHLSTLQGCIIQLAKLAEA